MRILVTGGAGFIGCHVGHALQQRGDEVVVLDDFNDYYDPRLKRARVAHLLAPATPVLELDLADAGAVGRAVRDVRPDVILHLAAWPGVRPSNLHPLRYTRANIGGTVSLLKAAVGSGVPKVVFASSSSVYGPQAPVPSPEETADDAPPSVYGMTKRVGEWVAELTHRRTGLQVICLRFFTVFGPWYRPDMAIWRFTERMLRAQPLRLHVWSSDGREVRRGFTDVRDITRGVLAALDRPQPFAVVNLGSSDPVPLRRLVGALEDALHVRARVEELVLPAEEEVQTAAASDRARALLGFAPSTPLEEGVRAFVAWYRDEFRQLFPGGLASSQYWSD